MSNPEDAWRLRCPVCGASQWEPVATEDERDVYRCRACSEFGQVDKQRGEVGSTK